MLSVTREDRHEGVVGHFVLKPILSGSFHWWHVYLLERKKSSTFCVKIWKRSTVILKEGVKLIINTYQKADTGVSDWLHGNATIDLTHSLHSILNKRWQGLCYSQLAKSPSSYWRHVLFYLKENVRFKRLMVKPKVNKLYSLGTN